MANIRFLGAVKFLSAGIKNNVKHGKQWLEYYSDFPRRKNSSGTVWSAVKELKLKSIKNKINTI